MRPGQKWVLDTERCFVLPGERITEEATRISGGGFHALYRGELTDFMEMCLFKRCFKDAIGQIIGHGSDIAVQVANQWINKLCARTNKNN